MNAAIKNKAQHYLRLTAACAALLVGAVLLTFRANPGGATPPPHAAPDSAMPSPYAAPDNALPSPCATPEDAPRGVSTQAIALCAADAGHATNASPAGMAMTHAAGDTDDAAPDAFGMYASATTSHPRTPQSTAALKEDAIRRRFGVVRRGGTWIPTTGGGTNLVYITTGTLPTGRIGEPYDVTFTAESGCPPYQWRITAGAIPPDCMLDQAAGALTGLPANPGTTIFMLEVTDSRGARDMAEYVLTIQPERELAILTDRLPAALPGTNFWCQLQAEGGIPPYTWTIAGELDGLGTLAFDRLTGELFGTIAADTPPGDIPLTIWLQDAQMDISRELTLHIRADLSILDMPTTPGRVATPFEFTFQATGGTEPYVWHWEGNLPPGLDFSTAGSLTGSPTAPGAYDIRVGVQDAAGMCAAGQFTLEIAPAPPDAVAGFTAFLSRSRVALQWEPPTAGGGITVRIVRNATTPPATPADGVTVYHGVATEWIDGDVAAGCYHYAAFLELDGAVVTTAPPPVVTATMPPPADPFADRVVAASLLHPNAFRAPELPGIVLGAPRGTGLAWGSSDIVSLGAAVNNDNGATGPYGGAIILEFSDNAAWDGPGPDFTIFENVFYICDAAGVPDPQTRFMEPAIVSVSQDGVIWRQFKTDFSPRYHPDTGQLNLRHPYCYNKGFAGVNPVMSNGLDPDPTDPAVSGGDSFDLADVGFEWIRYVRIQSTGGGWLADDDGDLIMHNEDSNAASRDFNKSGFDLDAMGAIWLEKVTAGGD